MLLPEQYFATMGPCLLHLLQNAGLAQRLITAGRIFRSNHLHGKLATILMLRLQDGAPSTSTERGQRNLYARFYFKILQSLGIRSQLWRKRSGVKGHDQLPFRFQRAGGHFTEQFIMLGM